jgi:hypothetical protein
MTLQDSVTEEGWCPIGVQCQVHCTPLMQANARAVADSPDGWAEDRWEERGCLVKESPCCGTAWGVDVRFGFFLFTVFACLHIFWMNNQELAPRAQ